jgi:hypothetical protein
VGGTAEAEVYAQVGLPYIEPELREDSGEIQPAQHNQLPKLDRLRQALRIESMCHGDAFRVIADRQVFIAARLRSFGHLSEGVSPVAVRCVTIQVAADLIQRHERKSTA